MSDIDLTSHSKKKVSSLAVWSVLVAYELTFEAAFQDHGVGMHLGQLKNMLFN